MQRPRGVNVTAALMAVAFILGNLHSILVQILPAARLHTMRPPSPPVMFSLIWLVAVVEVVSAVCIWAYWKGFEWGRILVLLDCAVQLIERWHFSKVWHKYPSMAVLGIGENLLALFLLWYLFRPNVRAWFAADATEKSRDVPDTPALHGQ